MNCVIRWYDSRNGKSGVGRKLMEQAEAEALCRELNEDHPHIQHEVVDSTTNETVFAQIKEPEVVHHAKGPDELTDSSPMPFGAHKGTIMAQVPSHYLDFIRGADWIDGWPAVRNYIDRTRKSIDQDLRRKENFQ